MAILISMRERSTSELALHDDCTFADQFYRYLSLMCVMGKGSSTAQRVLIDYNVSILHDALLQVFRV